MTPALKNYLATRDEFIADYLDRHGHNQATRTEAQDLADEWRDVARDAVQFARLAVKRAESVMGTPHIFDVAWEAFSVVYSGYIEASMTHTGLVKYAALNADAIKLAMSEGE